MWAEIRKRKDMGREKQRTKGKKMILKAVEKKNIIKRAKRGHNGKGRKRRRADSVTAERRDGERIRFHKLKLDRQNRIC